MSKIYKLPVRQSMMTMLCVLLVMMGISGPAAAQADRTFVIGEISNIPSMLPVPGATPTVPPTPTTTPAVQAPSFTTNGQVGSRQISFRESLAELGYVEGKNVTYVFDPALTTPDKLDVAAQSLVASHVDIIVAYGTAASVAAKKAVEGTNIPIVFVGPLDPVQVGLVKTLQNTEGNITGVGGVSEAYTKQLEWLVQLDPDIHSIYVPYTDLRNPAISEPVKAIQAFADKLGIQVITAELPTPEDATAALANLPDVDAIMLVPFAPNAGDFMQLGMERKMPVSYAFPNAMDLGPLLSYNYTEDGIGASAARFADRILRGAKPADLPVEIAPSLLAINLKTADAIGLNISDDVLEQASIIVR